MPSEPRMAMLSWLTFLINSKSGKIPGIEIKKVTIDGQERTELYLYTAWCLGPQLQRLITEINRSGTIESVTFVRLQQPRTDETKVRVKVQRLSTQALIAIVANGERVYSLRSHLSTLACSTLRSRLQELLMRQPSLFMASSPTRTSRSNQ